MMVKPSKEMPITPLPAYEREKNRNLPELQSLKLTVRTINGKSLKFTIHLHQV